MDPFAFAGAVIVRNDCPGILEQRCRTRPRFATLGATASDGGLPSPARRRYTRDNEIRVDAIVVPRHRWSNAMGKLGVYRAVDYRVEALSYVAQFTGTFDEDTSPSSRVRVTSSRDVPAQVASSDIFVSLRPVNRMLPRFERDWPVEVPLSEARLVPFGKDVLVCLATTVCVAALWLSLGFFGPVYLASVYSITSPSMEPTFRPGDAVLVEKVSVRVSHRVPHRGDVVFFQPPESLVSLIAEVSSSQHQREFPASTRLIRKRDLFVKRVEGLPGDIITIRDNAVTINGRYVEPAPPEIQVGPIRVPEGCLFVLGDNPGHSTDSRYWGFLPAEYVRGRPCIRCWPLSRFEILPPAPRELP